MTESRRSPAAVKFGERVRARRLALGWSQMHLAEEAGLHFTYISSIERGERNVSLHNILRLASALSVDAAALVGGLEPDPRPRSPAGRR